jgi:hypothetical protein
MKDFPRFVFTSPGPCACQGGTYGAELVQNEKELDAAISAGFFETVPEALAGIVAIASAEDQKAEDGAPAAKPKGRPRKDASESL